MGNSFKQRLLTSILSGVFWILLTFAVAGQLHYRGELDWPTALAAASRDLLPWVLLTPLAMWLSDRFTIERGRLRESLPVHIAASVVGLLLCAPLGLGLSYFVRTLATVLLGSEAATFVVEPAPTTSGAALNSFAGPQPYIVLLLAARLNIPLYWAIVSLSHAMLFYRRSVDGARHASELAAQLANARLQALTMQLQPHFLFNALNAIATFVHSDPDLADEMIGSLGDLLRTTLDPCRGEEIRLEEEVELLSRYLSVEQARFGERLRVSLEIAPTTLAARVPTLLLQPLVENAVRYGVEPRVGVGMITVRAWRDGEQLRLLIEDDGLGPIGTPRHGMGIGLANTRARLRELYGDQGWMEASSVQAGGWRVELGMPLRLFIDTPERALA